jgi:hypothetical protein
MVVFKQLEHFETTRVTAGDMAGNQVKDNLGLDAGIDLDLKGALQQGCQILSKKYLIYSPIDVNDSIIIFLKKR